MNFYVRSKHAFTLLELMLVVTIIGILAVIAVPGYKDYVIRSRLAEAYQNLGVLIKKQTTFFSEFNEFYDNLSHNPAILDQPMAIESIPGWDPNWYPAPIGSNVHFSYAASAGKVDSAGTELAISLNTGNGFHSDASPGNYARRSYPNADRCNSIISPSTYGATIQPNYDWVMIAAVADLNHDLGPNCTALMQLLQAVEGEVANAGGLIILNMGD